MKIIKLVFIPLFLMAAQPVNACGTPQNWMDAYEGLETKNKWRSSTSKLGIVVMLNSCGSSYLHKKEDEARLLRVLTDALSRKKEISNMRPSNRDIARQVRPYYRNTPAFENLVESVYRRFNCLHKVEDKNLIKIKGSGKTLYTYFGTNSCPGGKNIIVTVNAPGGGRLRSTPRGEIITSLKDGTKLQVTRKEGEWYRVINPVRAMGQLNGIGYVHKSIIKE